jgi:hypothetical protein
MTLREPLMAALVVASAAACSPTLEWREFVPEGSGVAVTFPCRPDRHARTVAVAGADARIEMLVCTAGGATYALSFFDVAEPGRISTVLADLRTRAVANIQGQALPGGAGQPSPLQIKGMTANDNAGRLAVAGRLPEGGAVQEQAAFFTRGLRVYQATVIGPALQPQAVETFFGGLSFPG